ncbi:hypothetical protein D3C78_1174090 [compost metagenome]
MDGAEMPLGIGHEAHGAFEDLPVHTCFTLPDLQRLMRRQLTAETVPGGLADVGHLFDEMGHGGDSLRYRTA